MDDDQPPTLFPQNSLVEQDANTNKSSRRGRTRNKHSLASVPSKPSGKAALSSVTQKSKSSKLEEEPLTPRILLRPSGKTADWDDFLSSGDNLHYIASVPLFKHAPLRKIWSEISIIGRTFEVPNPFVRCSRPINWFASTVHFAGYKALVEFESLGLTPKFMSWMSFCSDLPKPIGYSDKNRIVLHPPHEVRTEYPDFLPRAKEGIKLRSPLTVSPTHGNQISTEIRKCQKFALHTVLEVMDKTNISRMRLATVTALVGDRIHVTYVLEPKPHDSGFWFNVNSDLIHPIGWSQTVEHEIYGVPMSAKFTPLGLEEFPKYSEQVKVAKGQFLEVRHPAQPLTICAAVVHRVLKHGYFVVEIQVLPEELKYPTKFTYHITSPYIFECGFCKKHDINLVPPYGENPKTFSWNEYFSKRNLTKAPLSLLQERPPSKFKVGMKLEGVDITTPSYLGPCTVLKTAGHLLLLHFDGWRRYSAIDKAEMWVDSESPDIYPIGFAEMVGHEFQSSVEAVHPDDVA